jgi:hypothetical protein
VARTCADDALLAARLRRLLALADDEPCCRPCGGLRGAVWDDLVREMEAPRVVRTGALLGRYEVRGLLGEGAMGTRLPRLRPDPRARGGDQVARGTRGTLTLRRRAGGASSARRDSWRRSTTPTWPRSTAGKWTTAPRTWCWSWWRAATLAERLEKGPLTQAEAVKVALQIASALEEAHRKGVVHRDLKPANVAPSTTVCG